MFFFFHLIQHVGDFNYPRLADFGAAISGANKLLCQEVLEELDVRSFLGTSSILRFFYFFKSNSLSNMDVT